MGSTAGGPNLPFGNIVCQIVRPVGTIASALMPYPLERKPHEHEPVVTDG